MTSDNVKPRILLVDALRGFALMGLFLVHMVEYFELHWYAPKSSIAFDTTMWLFGGKAYAMFALLFGLSFYIIMDRQAAKGDDFRWRFAWRLLLLLIMGYLHSLYYSGDILMVLALTGFLLLPIYGLSNRTILIIGLLFLAQIPAMFFLSYLIMHPESATGNPVHWGLMDAGLKIFANGSFVEVFQQNIFRSHLGKWGFFLETGRLWNIIGLFMIGLWLGRIRFFERINELTRTCLWGLGLAIVIAVIAYFLKLQVVAAPLDTRLSQWVLKSIVSNYFNNAFMVAGVLLFILLCKIPSVERLVLLMAPTGRMTLTLYLAQSLIGIPLFFNWGLGWYATMDHSVSLTLGFVFWGAQILFATLWFKYFYYGPAEWLWRVGTYTRLDVPFKR